MFSPCPSSRKVPPTRSISSGGDVPSRNRPVSSPSPRAAASTTTSEKAVSSYGKYGKINSTAKKSPAGKITVRGIVEGPIPEPHGVIDDHFRSEVLRTALLQTAYTRRQLQLAAEAEKEKAECDLLRFWQLVHDAEEEHAALADKFAAVSEVIRIHSALQSLNDGLQDVVHAVVPVPSFIEDHSDLIKRQQRSVSVGIESKCNESQLVAQLERIRRLVMKTENKIDEEINFPLTLHATVDTYSKDGDFIAAVCSNADTLAGSVSTELPHIHDRALSAKSASLESFLIVLTADLSKMLKPVLSENVI